MKQLMVLWRLTGPHRWAVAGGALLRVVQSLFLGVAFGAAISIVVQLVDGRAPDDGDVTRVVVMCLVSLVGQLVTGWFAARLSWLASYRAVAHMRLRVLGHLREVPVAVLGERSRGDLAALLSSDLQLVEDFLSEGLPRLGQALGLPVLVIVAVGVQDPVLAITLAVPIIATVPVMSWSGRTISALGDVRQAKQANAAARMIDTVTAMPALRVFSTRERTVRWYGAAVEEFREISVHMVHRLLVPVAAAGLVLMLGIPLTVVVAGRAAVEGTANVALAAVVLVLALNVYQPVQGLLSTNESWQMAQAALRRVTAVLDIDGLPEPEPAAATPGDPDAAGRDAAGRDAEGRAGTGEGVDVRLDNVSYDYPDGTTGVEGVSMVAAAGRMTAIVGPSGSGKSTVLNLIARFDDPRSGTVLIGGRDLRELPPDVRSGLVTVVFQDVHLFPGTIAENIAVGKPGATDAEIRAAAELACADEFIRQLPLGYDTVLGEDGAGLSGGQRQRLSIARAALKDAPVVLLDEVTAALDPINEAAVHRGLSALLEGRTAIVVAHKLGTIASADHIVVLDGGRVAEVGDHESLIAAGGVYAGLWNTLRGAAEWTLG